MRTSQMALWSGIAILLLLITGFAVAFRAALLDFDPDLYAEDRSANVDLGDLTMTPLDLDGFTGIVINQGWQVQLEQASTWRVEISYPENLDAGQAASIEDGRLVLDSAERRPGRWWNWGGRAANVARISMPALTEIVVHGGADIDISGFSGTRLSVTVEGAANIEGYDGEFQELALALSGASNIDFRSLQSVDARIDLSGASNVRLAMAGGVLSGNLSGVGRVTYSGNVREERVDVSGFGSVSRTGFQQRF